jgi:uncharacterized protein with von Willebrand factor type A (vWA) domain
MVDSSGSTRIGNVLAELNWTHGRVARGAVVVIMSDGWDRGDPELLDLELLDRELGGRVGPRTSSSG